jgi:uncharacterized membrane protein YczE
MSATSGHGQDSVPRRARRPGLRIAWLYAGLAGFGVGVALMIRARLGLDPWDVLHQGIARQLGVPIGWVIIGVSAVVLVAWIPLRQRPGLGTLSNVVVVGLVVNGAMRVIPSPPALLPRLGMLAAAIIAIALATGCYIGAGLGPGPRDGLMTGIAARGHSIRVVRTAIEFSVLALGALLGGSVGIGTLAYALSIGPLVHFFLPRLTLKAPGSHVPNHKEGAISEPAAVRRERARLGAGRRRSRCPG